jgi:hypothetical protein
MGVEGKPQFDVIPSGAGDLLFASGQEKADPSTARPDAPECGAEEKVGSRTAGSG